MWFAKHKRENLLSQPFPKEWETYLLRNLAHYPLLSEGEQARLRDDLRVLVAEKRWEGCRGQPITDEVKVTIAAQASLLLLGLKHDYFSRARTVLVYPATFIIPGGEDMDEIDPAHAATGEAVYRGPVILTWDAVVAEGRDPSRGENVVIHEFAHQLDYLDGLADGTPELPDAALGKRWYEVMTATYERLGRKLDEGRKTFLGDYAATNVAEFFAVASERFFTVPDRLRQHHPDLYDVLAGYYRVDPARWFARGAG